MPILNHVNDDYLARLQDEFMKALWRASFDKEKNAAFLLSGEIVTAAIQILCVGAATSKAVDTPTKLREFSDECAKRIRVVIREIRSGGHMDWVETVHADERN